MTPAPDPIARDVFVTGATGYLGRSLLPALLRRGHRVRSLVRPGSESKLPAGTTPVVGNALDHTTFSHLVAPADTLVHLIGVPHPAPWKGPQFEAVDGRSAAATIAACQAAGVRHLVYLSVAHPAPVMVAYWTVRARAEAAIAAAGLAATCVRPWYVLGPGHRWAYALVPFYALVERIPATRPAALRLGLVTLRQTVHTLVWAVEHPAGGVRFLGVPEIRLLGNSHRE